MSPPPAFARAHVALRRPHRVLRGAFRTVTEAVFTKLSLPSRAEFSVDGLWDHSIQHRGYPLPSGAALCLGDIPRLHCSGPVSARV
jgi:hypothetical protein